MTATRGSMSRKARRRDRVGEWRNTVWSWRLAAVVLNTLLGAALITSIALHGYSSVYGLVAIAGLIVLSLAAATPGSRDHARYRRLAGGGGCAASAHKRRPGGPASKAVLLACGNAMMDDNSGRFELLTADHWGGFMVFVAGRDAYTVEGAIEVLLAYAAKYGATVQHYDLGGPDEIDVDDTVSTADLGRMVLIDAGLTGSDGAKLLNFELASALRGLGIDLRLEDVDQRAPGNDDVYARMNAVWTDLKAHRNIKDAKVSKLLHLKRPKLFPIIDSHILKIYKAAAEESGRSLGWEVAHYWSAIAADVRANQGEFTEIRQYLMGESSASRRLVYLSDLRFQDIVAWGPTAA